LVQVQAADFEIGGKMQLGDESLMSQKGHGTSASPVQFDLSYGVSNKLTDKICNFNRHFAERSSQNISCRRRKL